MGNKYIDNFDLAVKSFSRRVSRALELSDQEENYVTYKAWCVINEVLDRKKKTIQNRHMVHKINVDYEP